MSRPTQADPVAAPPLALIAIGLTALALAARAQTFGYPFIGFDEQFYALVGEAMRHGALPYVDIFDRKPIGLFLIYAVVRMFDDGPLPYQLAAAVFAATTAVGIYALARRIAPWPGALAGAAAYILWLDLTECEGGQAPVFFALPMVCAALLVMRALGREDARGIGQLGAVAMLLAGVAMQIKYTALFEGIVFGLTLLWTARRGGAGPTRLAMMGALWIGCALLPTALAAGYYWHLGQWPAFAFANFSSLSGRLADPLPRRLAGLAAIVAILAPLIAFAARRPPPSPTARFAAAWALAALAAVFGFGSWLAVHYAAPALPPLCIAAAPTLARCRRAAALLLLAGLIAGQALVMFDIARHGTRAQARELAAASQPGPGEELYVYNGPPALYLMTHRLPPTRWAFPGHLNTADEASAAAIGTDPTAEVRRIMATRPEMVVDTAPAYALGNAATHAVVQVALARDYRLTLRQALPGGRSRLVYRLR